MKHLILGAGLVLFSSFLYAAQVEVPAVPEADSPAPTAQLAPASPLAPEALPDFLMPAPENRSTYIYHLERRHLHRLAVLPGRALLEVPEHLGQLPAHRLRDHLQWHHPQLPGLLELHRVLTGYPAQSTALGKTLRKASATS